MGRGFVARDSDPPLIAVISLAPAAFCRAILHLSQFGSQFAGPQSQTHALAANHSCEVRQIGQKVLLKKTGME